MNEVWLELIAFVEFLPILANGCKMTFRGHRREQKHYLMHWRSFKENMAKFLDWPLKPYRLKAVSMVRIELKPNRCAKLTQCF